MNLTFSTCFRPNRRRAFTLIEILIVLALTALLFALLLIPLVSAINYTRQAQSLTATQDAVRIVREGLTRELGSALYVFDGDSHPFKIATDPNQPGEDKYTNFLDLQILDSQGMPVVAHAYNAKLDFVLPKVNQSGTAVDPTTNEPITYAPTGGGSAIITSPALIFPAAADTTMTRYFMGLKNPANPYNNTREGHTVSTGDSSTDNTYILYRVQFQPYKKGANGSVTPNTELFATRPKLDAYGNPVKDASGNPVLIPDLDDPDFFRYVNQGATTDVNWLDDGHANFPAQDAAGTTGTPGSPAQHNNRVDKWVQLAKPVIPGPNVDLIQLPHYSNGKLAYDQSGPFAGIAHTGIAYDPVTNTSHPIVNTTVTFRPGTVSGSATPATTASYASQGVIAGADQTTYAYVPTVYTTSNQSWSQPYKVTLTPPVAGAGQSAGGQVYTTGLDSATGDFAEYDATGTEVFDITTGLSATGKTSYIPLTLNADSGTISFDTPALPDPTNRYNRQWVYLPASPTLDLKTTDSNGRTPPLKTLVDPKYTDNSATPNPIPTARIVPGSLRVYGPDDTPGPGKGQPVLYSEANDSGQTPGYNQYKIDYSAGLLTFTGADAATTFNGTATVSVLYDYQANTAPVGTVSGSTTQMTSYALAPVSVSVDYQTRDLVDVTLGARLFDVSNGLAEVIPSETKIKIGNSNR